MISPPFDLHGTAASTGMRPANRGQGRRATFRANFTQTDERIAPLSKIAFGATETSLVVISYLFRGFFPLDVTAILSRKRANDAAHVS